MPLLRALLSALTLFGGHFLNRRLDRVRLIGLLFVLTPLALIGLFFLFAAATHENFALIDTLFGVPCVLVGALAALSAVLTFRDARQRSVRPLNILLRVTGTAISLLGALLLAAMLLVSGRRVIVGFETLTGLNPIEPSAPLHLGVHFGGGIQYPDEPIATTLDRSVPTPPRGRERLRGRVTLDGAGVKGLELYLVLDNQYETQKIETDVHGIFEVRLPSGTWLVNSVEVVRWDEKPAARDLQLFSGHEPTRDNAWYVNFASYTEGGLEVALPLAPDALAMDLELRDTVAITWPPHTEPHGLRATTNVPEATYSTGVIRWHPVNGASEYEVQITQVTRTPNSISSDSLLRRRLTATSLPFISLPKREKSPATAPDEYEVHIYAFDDAGKLVTESEADYGRAFRLVGATRLGKEQWDSSGGPNPIVISEEYEANEHLLARADELLDEKQFDAARRTLDRVTKDAPRGRALALRGRLAALQGDCATALELFDESDAEGGTCAPIAARQLCAAPQK
jgi:hypothetical protein